MKNIKFLNLFTLVILSFILVGCFGNSSDSELNGNITLNGSTSMKKVATSLSEAFMELNPDTLVTVEFTGSGAGIQAVANGTSSIGNSSRSLKQEELDLGLIENVIAIDGIAIITDNSNTVSNLTLEQLIGIFNGSITNWSELGGNDQNIVVIGREAGSGTRSAFEEILSLEDSAVYAQEIDSNGAVLAKVASIPGSIGYVSLDILNDDVKAINLNNVEPLEENIVSGEYPLSRPFIMVTKGEIEQQEQLVIEFLNFVFSEQGSEIIRQVGLIPVK